MKKSILFALLGVFTSFSIWAQDLNKTDSKGLKQGRWQTYFGNNDIETEGNYVDDVKQGVWKSYHSKGLLKSVEHYTDGVLQGVVIEIDSRGYLLSEVEYVDGKKEGLERR